jgi:diacylglycerol kinase (ATP)
MRATLIYNGDPEEGDPTSDELKSRLQEIGFEVKVASKDTLEEALDDPSELVVSAGGDGTVGAVVRCLVGRNTVLAILPLGTANNVAKTLGLTAPMAELVAGLKNPRRCRLDVGLARGPFGERYFIEAVGLGLFARTLSERASEEDKEEKQALRRLMETLSGYRARDWKITLDGEDLSGRYLLVEAMNIKLIGPNLALAPDADPCDGLLDLVLVGEDGRDKLGAYMNGRLGGNGNTAPDLGVRRGKGLIIELEDRPLHIDDETEKVFGTVTLELEHGAIELWLPTLASR